MAADASGGRKASTKLTQLTLHLGVVEQYYRNGGKTTGDVAEILEEKYAIIETFVELRKERIAEWLEHSLSGAFESLLMGQRTAPFGAARSLIEQEFRDFINSGEAESAGIPGTPTAAAEAGVNHRLAHPYAKANPRRPSFRDTSLYVDSFHAWSDYD